MPVFWSMPPQILTGLAAAGGIALIISMGNIGGFIAPYPRAQSWTAPDPLTSGCTSCPNYLSWASSPSPCSGCRAAVHAMSCPLPMGRHRRPRTKWKRIPPDSLNHLISTGQSCVLRECAAHRTAVFIVSGSSTSITSFPAAWTRVPGSRHTATIRPCRVGRARGRRGSRQPA